MKTNNAGFAHIIGLVMALIVFGTIAAGGYRVYRIHQESKLTASVDNKEEESTNIKDTVETEVTPQNSEKTSSGNNNQKDDKPTASKSTGSTSKPVVTPAETCDSISKTTDKISSALSAYSISAHSSIPDNQYSTVTISKISSDNACEYSEYADLFISSFKKMPKPLVAAANADVYFASKVTNSSYGVAAAPLGPSNAVVYDIFGNSGGDEYKKHVVLHEYWHQIDFSLFGSFYYGDSAWSDCNEEGFSYGSGGINAYSGESDVPEETEGFVNEYSKIGIEEDRAEIFSFMIGLKSNLDLIVSTNNDSGIECKIDLMEDKIQIHAPSYEY